MRVLFVHDAAIPGGVETRLLAHAQVLRTLGHEVVDLRKDGILASCFDELGVRSIDIDFETARLDFAACVEKVRSIIRSKKIDFCDIHPVWALLPGALAAIAEGIPYTINVHGASFYDSQRIQNLVAMPLVLQMAAFGTANSQESLEYMLSVAPGVAFECLNVPNTLDTRAYADCPPVSSPATNLAIISRLDRDKEASLNAAIHFVEAYAKRSPDVPRVRLCGGGEIAHQFIDRLSQLASRRLIVFEARGYCLTSQEDIKWADAVLGVGRVALEGMSARRPVVVCGAQGAIVGLVRKSNVERLFAANMSGRNMEEMPLPSSVDSLLRYSRTELEFLGSWAEEKVGLDRVRPWVERAEAAALRRMEPAPWVAALAKVFGEVFRLDVGGEEVGRWSSSLESALSLCRGQVDAQSQELRVMRAKVSEAEAKQRNLELQLREAKALLFHERENSEYVRRDCFRRIAMMATAHREA